MLQSATWELGRKQRMLLPLATPALLAFHRSMSHTSYRHAAGSRDAVATEDNRAETPAKSDLDDFLNKFSAARRSKDNALGVSTKSSASIFAEKHKLKRKKKAVSGTSKRRSGVDANALHHGGRVSDNIDPEYFEANSAHAADVSGSSEYWEQHDDTADVARHSYAGNPVDKPHSSSSFGEWLNEDDDRFTRESELSWMLNSFRGRTNLSPRERSSGMMKSFVDYGPNLMIWKSTSRSPTRDAWQQKVMSARSLRLPIIVMQMLIRREIITTGENRELLDLLPKGEQRRILIELVSSNGYSRQDIDDMVHIIEAKTGQERCERFLQHQGHKPIWLLHFVIRPAAIIRNARTLIDLMSYCEKVYDGRREWEKDQMVAGKGNPRSTMHMLNMSPQLFGHTLKYLAIQSMVLDGRLLVKVADLAAQYIKNMGGRKQSSEKIYYDQCELFNHALEVLTPSLKPLPPTWHRPMEYYWLAQKNLLSMSASLDQQLLVSKAGFRAVREVLAGLDKNQLEIHNSMRHAQTWPPYLEIGDGIDEMTDPEDNWSRSVSAGTLQQEAGFDLDKQDQTLDILQGRAPDGTPTIQQRIIRQPNPEMGPWEASIRATRNAQEAWAMFNDPPEPGLVPGLHEYKAMFTKLFLRDADPAMMLRPGDRPFNFPVKQDPNLTEFEKSRMRPPSVDRLYMKMRRAGIRPSGGCLDVLVANAKSLRMGHQYIGDSDERAWALMIGRSGGPSAEALRKIRTPLVAAYIKLISSVESKPGRELLRAVRICERCFEDEGASPVWARYVWGIILKAFSAKAIGQGRFGRTLTEQLRTYHLIIDKIEHSSPIRLLTLIQLGKCLRKAVWRAHGEHLKDLESHTLAGDSPLKYLYDTGARGELVDQTQASAEEPWLYFFRLGSQRMKRMLKTIMDREADVNKLFDIHEIESLEQIKAREDPVRATDACELMTTWAHLGEYEEMASFLEWLVQQWDSAELVEQLEGYEEVPGFADFNETLCLFRIYAEPMLSEERVDRLRESISKAQVVWTWPDDELLTAFRETRDEPFCKLEHVLEWTRYRQALDRGEEPGTLLRPQKWQGLNPVKTMTTYARSQPFGRLWDMETVQN